MRGHKILCLFILFHLFLVNGLLFLNTCRPYNIIKDTNNTIPPFNISSWDLMPIQLISQGSIRDSNYPSIANDQNGNLYIVWLEDDGDDFDVVYKKWDVETSAWKAMAYVYSGSYDSDNPDLFIDNNANMHVVWENANATEPQRYVYYKYLNVTDNSWSTGFIVSSEIPNTIKDPALCVDSEGNVHFVWVDYNQLPQHIYYRSLNLTSNQWSNTEIIGTGGAWMYDPKIVVDDNRSLIHITWADSVNYDNEGTDRDIIYRFLNRSSDVWSPFYVVSSGLHETSQEPDLNLDHQGCLHFIWMDSTNIKNAGDDYDIFYRFLNITQFEWSEIEVITHDSDETSQEPSFAVDTQHNIHVTWMEFIDLGLSDIRYTNKNYETKSWSASELISIGSSDISRKPSITVDEESKIHIVWEDKENNLCDSGTDEDIFYTFFNTIPEISHPPDIYYQEGENQTIFLEWVIHDTSTINPQFSVFKDGQEIKTGNWESDDIIKINITSLESGVYNYEIQVSDGYGSTNNDLVRVQVNDQPVVHAMGIFSCKYRDRGKSFTWYITDEVFLDPTYSILLNGMNYETLDWPQDMQIEVSLDGFSIGEYNFSIFIDDGLEGVFSHEVKVYILAINEIEEFFTDLLKSGLIIPIVGAIVSIIVGIVWKKMKK